MIKTLIITVILVLAITATHGQVAPYKTGKIPNSKPSVKIPQSTVEAKPGIITLNQINLSNVLNGGSISDQSVSDLLEKTNDLSQMIAKERNDYIYGSAKTNNYQIRYSSAPVKAFYDEFIPPLIANYTYAINNHKFLDLLVDKLALAAFINGVYTSPEAQILLKKVTREVFVKADITNSAALQPNTTYQKNTFYKPYLDEVFKGTESVLNKSVTWTTATSYNGYNTSTGESVSSSTPNQPNVLYNSFPSTTTTSYSEFLAATSFMDNGAINVCVEVALTVKKNPGDGKLMAFFGDSFTKALMNAYKGTLFKPIKSYKGEYSQYEVYSIFNSSFQNRTKNNGLSIYWDLDFNCPSSFAYSAFGAEKITTSMVYNP